MFSSLVLLGLIAVDESAIPLLAADRFIWSDGHGDVKVDYHDGSWSWRVDNGRELDDVVIQLRDNSRAAVPSNPAFAFLGNTGDPIWIVPATQKLGVPFVGVTSDGTSAGTFVDDRFDLRLTRVDAPGDFILWTVSPEGQPRVLMNSKDGISEVDVADAPAPGHWHPNWGFTSPGTYRVGLTAGGILATGGGNVQSDEEVCTFSVGVLAEGEADIAVAYESGALEFHVHDESTDTEFDPAHVALHAGPETWRTVPADAAFAFLGNAGDSLHVFPQDETEGVLFLGLAGEEIPAGTFAGDAVRIRVTGFSGPGQFFYYEVSEFGAPTVLVNTADGLSAADEVTVVAGSHAHRNWAFTAPGVYRVTLVASGELAAAGGTVTSEPTTLLFEVFGPEFVDHGEIDLEILHENGELGMAFVDESAEKEYGAEELVLVVLPAAQRIVPADPAFAFLGEPGRVTHVLPQEETAGLLFPGIAGDEIGEGVFVGDAVSLRLVGVTGPGRFALYELDAFGTPTVFMNSADGVGAADVFPVPVGSHAHANWAFSEPGEYRIQLKAAGVRVDGNTPSESATVTLSFLVESAGPRLTGTLVNGGADLRLSWSSRTGRSYQVRSRADVGMGTWSNEGDAIQGTGGTLTVTVPRTGDVVKVFQVVESR
ncbi:MAG: choice-of-anchor M domain-containing protein [Limisphaerales bacterium]